MRATVASTQFPRNKEHHNDKDLIVNTSCLRGFTEGLRCFVSFHRAQRGILKAPNGADENSPGQVRRANDARGNRIKHIFPFPRDAESRGKGRAKIHQTNVPSASKIIFVMRLIGV